MNPARPIGLSIAVVLFVACATAAPNATRLPTSSNTATPPMSPAPTPSTEVSGTLPLVATPPALAIEPIDRETVLAEPEAVAALLDDPATRLDGVVSLVASLGIGIYSPDGTQILQGSESSDTSTAVVFDGRATAATGDDRHTCAGLSRCRRAIELCGAVAVRGLRTRKIQSRPPGLARTLIRPVGSIRAVEPQRRRAGRDHDRRHRAFAAGIESIPSQTRAAVPGWE